MKKIGCLCLSIITCFSLIADEGMWMLNNLRKDNWDRMKQLGFVLSPDQLYNESKPSLKDAVVHFNGGCTGVTVSGKGLIFTNHHCGYGAIQSQSSLEHDYLKNGFIAQTNEEEIPIPGMFVRYLIHTENVTDRILSAIDTIRDEADRLIKIEDISKMLEDSISNKEKFIVGEVSAYFDNNAYYLNIYEVFNDVRMVFAPPSSIGKFGDETDNWMWPRHTGDFSIFRVYANAENQPAEYEKTNMPYKPKYVASVSMKGYKENNFSMTIGYPGRTNRYLSSWGVEQKVNSVNKPRIEARGIKQSIWKEAMLASDETRIKYASKYAISSNYWKNSIGMNRGIERMKVIERKQVTEKQFSDWVNENPEKKAFYGEAIKLIQDGYTSSGETQKAFTYLLEAFMNGSEIIRLTYNAMNFDMTESPDIKSKNMENKILPPYKDYDPLLDEKVFASMLQIVKEKVPQDYLPYIFKEIDKKYKGDYKKYAEYVFRKSIVPYPDKLEKILQDSNKIKKLDKDPAYQFTKSVREAIDAAIVGVSVYRYDIIKGERLYFAGLQQMMPNKNFSSDANSTMRMSYGSISGYSPSDAVWYNYFTTTKGIFEKYKKNDPEFDVQPEILSLLASKDFSQYANEKGDMNVCFLSNNDITGGNSGSPMFNANGQLIGLAFDGNWEAMSGDIAFEQDIQKTIGVDIRYVLFMIDKWGKCPRLIKEMTIE